VTGRESLYMLNLVWGVTNFMDLSPSSEAASYADTEELPGGCENFHFSMSSRLALGSTRPLINGNRGLFPRE
jgi:hypothetical protein